MQIQTKRNMALTEYNQQAATFHNLFISVRRSTRFRRFLRPSSGAQNCTYSVRYLSDQYCYLLLALLGWNCILLVVLCEYGVRINYRRILHLLHLATPVTRPDSVWFLPVAFRQGQCLRPTTSKDTTRIVRVHQHRNRERHTRHAWEGLAGMGVSPGNLSCHTWGCTSNAFKVTMKLQTFLFEMVVTSCISVQYLRKYGFAKSSDNLYAPCIYVRKQKEIYEHETQKPR